MKEHLDRAKQHFELWIASWVTEAGFVFSRDVRGMLGRQLLRGHVALNFEFWMAEVLNYGGAGCLDGDRGEDEGLGGAICARAGGSWCPESFARGDVG